MFFKLLERKTMKNIRKKLPLQVFSPAKLM